MHGGDDTNLQMALMNLAFVRGRFGSGNDAGFARVGLAFMLWMTGFLLVLILSVVLQVEVVVPAGLILLGLAFWRFGVRAPKES